MTKVVHPRLEVTANGAVALLHTVRHGFKVYDLPGLTLKVEQESYANVFDVVLSSSGAAVAVRTMTDSLEVISASGRQAYQLPWKQEQISALAISDAGDKVALLLVDPTASAAGGAVYNGLLQIWALPTSRAPLASTPVPVYDIGSLAANGDFSTLLVTTSDSLGTNRFAGVYSFARATGQLAPQWTEAGATLNRIPVILYGDWVWAVQTDGLIGRHGADPPVRLPGTLRERQVFSPTGQHLLIIQVAAVHAMTSGSILFHLYDLSTQEEVKHTTRRVEHYHTAHFVVSQELALFALRATEAGTVEISELAWAK
jgi:hypothetical protein